MSFAKKHVVITGGTGEIGLTMATTFARQGAEVTLLDKVQPTGAVAEAVEHISARFHPMDVTDEHSVQTAIASLPGIDVAIANAGVHRGARFLDLTPENWRLMLDVNLTGVFLFCQAAARNMAARNTGGSILITGSWVQDVPNVDNTGYCTSKAGAGMLARCMALELAEVGIRVNVVAPGIVDAGMAKRQIKIDPNFARKAVKGIPLGRLQTADQVAQAAVFLSSEQAASITGATLLVDGGLSLFKYE
jgi:NAD(P)-dependent dehydrogenase (short-subunit alcohol dehydrogenase family)